MAKDRASAREAGGISREARETRLAVSVLSVCRRRSGIVVTYLRGECITGDVEHGKFAGNTVRW